MLCASVKVAQLLLYSNRSLWTHHGDGALISLNVPEYSGRDSFSFGTSLWTRKKGNNANAIVNLMSDQDYKGTHSDYVSDLNQDRTLSRRLDDRCLIAEAQQCRASVNGLEEAVVVNSSGIESTKSLLSKHANIDKDSGIGYLSPQKISTVFLAEIGRPPGDLLADSVFQRNIGLEIPKKLSEGRCPAVKVHSSSTNEVYSCAVKSSELSHESECDKTAGLSQEQLQQGDDTFADEKSDGSKKGVMMALSVADTLLNGQDSASLEAHMSSADSLSKFSLSKDIGIELDEDLNVVKGSGALKAKKSGSRWRCQYVQDLIMFEGSGPLKAQKSSQAKEVSGTSGSEPPKTQVNKRKSKADAKEKEGTMVPEQHNVKKLKKMKEVGVSEVAFERKFAIDEIKVKGHTGKGQLEKVPEDKIALKRENMKKKANKHVEKGLEDTGPTDKALALVGSAKRPKIHVKRAKQSGASCTASTTMTSKTSNEKPYFEVTNGGRMVRLCRAKPPCASCNTLMEKRSRMMQHLKKVHGLDVFIPQRPGGQPRGSANSDVPKSSIRVQDGGGDDDSNDSSNENADDDDGGSDVSGGGDDNSDGEDDGTDDEDGGGESDEGDNESAEHSSEPVHDTSMLHKQVEWDCSSEPQLEAVRTISHRHEEQVDSLDAHGESSNMMADMANLEADDAFVVQSFLDACTSEQSNELVVQESMSDRHVERSCSRDAQQCQSSTR
ncbi:hypothetical protein L7F22_034686 [Adiantum nelumboides]|nr:hypothetical protein [Adiantum nelumboides]